MTRLLLLTTLLALTLTAPALASPTQSVTCTAAPIAPRVTCFYETPALTLGALEITTGAYAVLNPHTTTLLSFAPYLTIAQYTPTYAWWIELRLPKINGIPAVIGVTHPIRAGMTYRW